MPKDDSQSPATKEDLRSFMEHISKQIDDLYDANKRWKDEILDSNKRWKKEIKQHFDVVVEQIRAELTGAKKDKLSLLEDSTVGHERRITRLEKHTGLVAA